MPKYLLEGSYLAEGSKGLLKEGGTSRRKIVEGLAESMGGSIEALYYAFGENDIYVIVDVPDDATMTALSLAVNSTGALRVKTTVLMDPEVIDQASNKTVDYFGTTQFDPQIQMLFLMGTVHNRYQGKV